MLYSLGSYLPPISISFSIHAVVELFQGHVGDIITSISPCLVDSIDEIIKLFETKGHLVIGWNDQDLSLAQSRSLVFAWMEKKNKEVSQCQCQSSRGSSVEALVSE
jgi:hypothetical protein